MIRCSFCRKNQEDVAKLVAGPHVYICDECVPVCVEALNWPIRKMVDADIFQPAKPISFRDFYAERTGLRPGQWGEQYDETFRVIENMIDVAAEYLTQVRR